MATDENIPDLKKNPKAVHPVGIDIPKWGGKPEKHGNNRRRTVVAKKVLPTPDDSSPADA